MSLGGPGACRRVIADAVIDGNPVAQEHSKRRRERVRNVIGELDEKRYYSLFGCHDHSAAFPREGWPYSVCVRLPSRGKVSGDSRVLPCGRACLSFQKDGRSRK